MKPFISLTLALLLLVVPTTNFAHKIPTHKRITTRAIQFLSERVPELRCGLPEGLIQEGPEYEDDWPRFVFHFLPTLSLSLSTCDSIEWGLSSRRLPCSSLVPSFMLTLSQFSLTNEHTYKIAVERVRTSPTSLEGWREIGYPLHLAEDLTSPAHTRNDAHLLWDPFEVFNSDRDPELPTGDLLRFSNPEALFRELQKYTQENYYSDDTVFDFPGPISSSDDWFYFYDSSGRKIAYKGPLYYASGSNPQVASINSTIAREQFDELGPKAVQYAASFLYHYYQQAKPALAKASTSPKFEIVAQTDTNGLHQIDPNISINDRGTVAFIGQFMGKDIDGNDILTENIFAFDSATGGLKKLMKDAFQLPFPNPIGAFGQIFSPAVQINNLNQVIARRRMNANVLIGDQFLTGPFTYIESWVLSP